MTVDYGTDREGLARRDHQDTSKVAAALVFPRSGTQRKRVLAAVWRAPTGATRDELAATLGMSPNTVRPRVKELIDGGWVEPSGFTRPTPLGRDGEVLFVTAKAEDEIARRITERS